MATLTISSGVHVGSRGAGSINQGWFAGTTSTQFTQFSLTSSNSDVRLRTGPQAIIGHASLTDQPIQFEFARRTRDVLTDSLAAVAAKDVLNGGPRTTLSGYRDAVARSGYLASFAWSERDNASGTNAFTVWGICTVNAPTVRGTTESMVLLVYPCDVLWWTGTETLFTSPTAYAAFPAA